VSAMNASEHPLERKAGGSLWKGLALAFLCQFAYLLFVYELPAQERELRTVGTMLFALLQFAYLFPLAVFYQKRNQQLTSNGVIIAGVISLLAEAVWFAYAVVHGTLPSISGS